MTERQQREEAEPLVSEVFASRLREARKAREWTQEDLATELGKLGAPMDRTTIAKLEKGQREVRLAELIAIAAALDVAPVHLFLPVSGGKPVRLTPSLEVDINHARSWARGRRPLDPANARFYTFQSPGDLGVSFEGAPAEHIAELVAAAEERLRGVKVEVNPDDPKPPRAVQELLAPKQAKRED